MCWLHKRFRLTRQRRLMCSISDVLGPRSLVIPSLPYSNLPNNHSSRCVKRIQMGFVYPRFLCSDWINSSTLKDIQSVDAEVSKSIEESDFYRNVTPWDSIRICLQYPQLVTIVFIRYPKQLNQKYGRKRKSWIVSNISCRSSNVFMGWKITDLSRNHFPHMIYQCLFLPPNN